MPEKRFFVPSALNEHSSIKLEGDEAHHLKHVMRCKPGDGVELINGRGSLADSEVAAIGKTSIELKIGSVRNEQPPAFEIILAQAIPRQGKLEIILEKGTELGMTSLWLFPGKLSEKKEFRFSETQLTRMEKITIAATKQCGRLFLPTIELKPSLESWEKPLLPLFYGDTSSDAPTFYSSWLKEPPTRGLIFIVGPEPGFHLKELEKLKDLGAQGVKLHHNILRTETAPLAALSLISQLRI